MMTLYIFPERENDPHEAGTLEPEDELKKTMSTRGTVIDGPVERVRP